MWCFNGTSVVLKRVGMYSVKSRIKVIFKQHLKRKDLLANLVYAGCKILNFQIYYTKFVSKICGLRS